MNKAKENAIIGLALMALAIAIMASIEFTISETCGNNVECRDYSDGIRG